MRTQLVGQVTNVATRRALRRHGFSLSAREICEMVSTGSPDRSAVTSELLAVSNDRVIADLLAAAFSVYVDWLVETTTVRLPVDEQWAIGLEALSRAIASAARCGGSDLHIIRSTKRDFLRAVNRCRRDAHRDRTYLSLEREGSLVEPSVVMDDQMSSVTVGELVEWLRTEFDADKAAAEIVVATRLGGFALGPSGDSSVRVRNCRSRRRIEDRVRKSRNPAEGLAANVLSRAA